jgi:hypothetical protein
MLACGELRQSACQSSHVFPINEFHASSRLNLTPRVCSTLQNPVPDRHPPDAGRFLRQPGAPLDNNICERALKKAILHRKNALFYKTCHGAHVGDVFMSLIYTCEFCGANPFNYLTELDRHAADLSATPQNWMPWNYRQTLAATPSDSPPR